jgi:hypothetical protein
MVSVMALLKSLSMVSKSSMVAGSWMTNLLSFDSSADLNSAQSVSQKLRFGASAEHRSSRSMQDTMGKWSVLDGRSCGRTSQRMNLGLSLCEQKT